MQGGTRRRRLRWTLNLVMAVVMSGLVGACGGDSKGTAGGGESTTEVSPPTELEDGSYSCEASNSTSGNGPYALDCEKSGDTITLRFPNGGHIDLDIESQESADGKTWEIEATNDQNGDSWTVTIDD
jgi:hypothetical protein